MIFLACDLRRDIEQIERVVEVCDTQGTDVHLVSNFFHTTVARATPTSLGDVPLLTLKSGPQDALSLALTCSCRCS